VGLGVRRSGRLRPVRDLFPGPAPQLVVEALRDAMPRVPWGCGSSGPRDRREPASPDSRTPLARLAPSGCSRTSLAGRAWPRECVRDYVISGTLPNRRVTFGAYDRGTRSGLGRPAAERAETRLRRSASQHSLERLMPECVA
jgi:hypothetical protein